MPIRLTNPHAQSKDPCSLIGASFAAGVLRVSHDCVERALLPVAFDLDLDFDREGHEFHSCRPDAPQRNAASAAEVPAP